MLANLSRFDKKMLTKCAFKKTERKKTAHKQSNCPEAGSQSRAAEQSEAVPQEWDTLDWVVGGEKIAMRSGFSAVAGW